MSRRRISPPALLIGIGLLGLQRYIKKHTDHFGGRRDPATNNQCAIITGGARGLGLSIARRYAKRGVHLALCSRHEDDLRAAQSDLKKLNPHIEVLTAVLDVSDREAARGFIENIQKHFKKIDILINCAGIIQSGPYESMDHHDFEAILKSNLTGMMNTCEFAIPQMLRLGSGQVVNITSIGGLLPIPHLVPYVTSKFGAVGFSTSLSTELRSKGVSVTTLAPGLMRTGSFAHAQFKGDHDREFQLFSWIENSPLTSMNLERAVDEIMSAIDKKMFFKVIGRRARIQHLGFHLFPNLSLAFLSWLGSQLPRPRYESQVGESALEGRFFLETMGSGLTAWLGHRAMKRYNEIRS